MAAEKALRRRERAKRAAAQGEADESELSKKDDSADEEESSMLTKRDGEGLQLHTGAKKWSGKSGTKLEDNMEESEGEAEAEQEGEDVD